MDVLDQLPPLPESWKRLFIKAYPWLLIIGGILTGSWIFPTLFSSFPATATYMFRTPYTFGIIGSGFLWLVLVGINAVISLLAGFQMLKMHRSGWKLAMIEVVLSIFIAFISGGGLGLILSLLALYFLWQVKGYYF